MKQVFGLLIQPTLFIIRFISAFFRALGMRGCRFHPSCSSYACEAYNKLSYPQATFKVLSRIFRCHPFSAGGYDPVERSS